MYSIIGWLLMSVAIWAPRRPSQAVGWRDVMVLWPEAPAPRVNARSRSPRRSRQQQTRHSATAAASHLSESDDDDWGHWRAPPATGAPRGLPPAEGSEGLIRIEPRPKRLPAACRKQLVAGAKARAAKNSKKQELSEISEDDLRAASAQARELAGLPPVPWGGRHPWCVNGLKCKLMSTDGAADYQMVKLREGKPTYFCMMC